jgi:hypothetical protein
MGMNGMGMNGMGMNGMGMNGMGMNGMSMNGMGFNGGGCSSFGMGINPGHGIYGAGSANNWNPPIEFRPPTSDGNTAANGGKSGEPKPRSAFSSDFSNCRRDTDNAPRENGGSARDNQGPSRRGISRLPLPGLSQ